VNKPFSNSVFSRTMWPDEKASSFLVRLFRFYETFRIHSATAPVRRNSQCSDRG
jgi:hypothetical protein